LFTASARDAILFEEGIFFLTRQSAGAEVDFAEFVLGADDEMVPTSIEAWSQASNDDSLKRQVQSWHVGESFDKMINTLLVRHRISFELIDHEMVPFSSRERHVEVVAPTLSLLHRGKGWAKVEDAYKAALGEIARGEAANAITDAGTALQEGLVLLGCEGNALGPLIKVGEATRPHCCA
jgi:hypothetical protein